MLFVLLLTNILTSLQMQSGPTFAPSDNRIFFNCDPYLDLEYDKIIEKAVEANASNGGKPLWIDCRNIGNLRRIRAIRCEASATRSEFPLELLSNFFFDLDTFEKAKLRKVTMSLPYLRFLIQQEMRPIWEEHLYYGYIPSKPFEWWREHLRVEELDDLVITGFIPIVDDDKRIAIRSKDHSLCWLFREEILRAKGPSKNPGFYHDLRIFGDQQIKAIFSPFDRPQLNSLRRSWHGLVLIDPSTKGRVKISEMVDIQNAINDGVLFNIDRENARRYESYLAERNIRSSRSLAQFYEKLIRHLLACFVFDDIQILEPYQDFIIMDHLWFYSKNLQANGMIADFLFRTLKGRGQFVSDFHMIRRFNGSSISDLIDRGHIDGPTFGLWQRLYDFDEFQTKVDMDFRHLMSFVQAGADMNHPSIWRLAMRCKKGETFAFLYAHGTKAAQALNSGYHGSFIQVLKKIPSNQVPSILASLLKDGLNLHNDIDLYSWDTFKWLSLKLPRDIVLPCAALLISAGYPMVQARSTAEGRQLLLSIQFDQVYLAFSGGTILPTDLEIQIRHIFLRLHRS